MSEVKRYYVNLDHGTRYAAAPGCDQAMYKAEDFDRVSSDLDAALGRESRAKEGLAKHWRVVCDQRAKIDALQDLLTAADERLDELLIMLRMTWVDSNISGEDCRRIDAALKRAEGGGHEHR